MKINKVHIRNFKKVEDQKIEFSEKPLVISGPNGSGKTSMIEALRYGITGESPVGVVRDGANQTIITMIANDTVEFERYIDRPNKKSMMLMGKRTTNTAGKLAMEDVLDIKTKETDIVLASEVFKLKPNELGELFFQHDHRSISIDNMLKVMRDSEATTKKTAIMIKGSDELPADVVAKTKALFDKNAITLDMLQKASDVAKSKKSEHATKAKFLAVKSADFEGMIRPEFDPDLLRKDLEDIIGVEKGRKMNEELKKTYEKAKTNKEKQDKMIIAMKAEIGMIAATKPVPEKLDAIKEELGKISAQIMTKETIKTTLAQNANRLKKTLDALDTTVCPISKKLTCNIDKTAARAELGKELTSTEKSMRLNAEELEELKKSERLLKEKEKRYIDNQVAWSKKCAIKENLEKLEANEIVVPEEPTDYSTKSLAEEKKRIQDTLAAIKTFDDAEKAYRETAKEKRLEKVYAYIEEALGSKGPVAMAFLKATATLLEKKVAERTKILSPNIEVRFDVTDGIKPYFKFKAGDMFHSFYSLSTGQKIIATLLITDILNYYCGSEILIIDELNDLDKDNFEAVLRFVTNKDVKADYQNIILCMVNHKSLVESLKKFDVDVLETA